jgi:hypothetical protein
LPIKRRKDLNQFDFAWRILRSVSLDFALRGAEYWRWQVYGGTTMDEQHKALIRRRDLLLGVTAAGAIASVGAASSETPTENRRDKRRAQYQANSPEVQTYYRVNRYPVK